MSRRGAGGTRWLALCGIVGPAAFIVAWMVGGAMTAGYSPVDDAISRLAARGAPARVLMTAGFVCFGIAVPAYAVVLRHRLRGSAWIAAVATGAATVGVALFPLGTSSTVDGVHNALAGLGYVTLVAVPLLAAAPLLGAGLRRAAVVSLVVAGLAGASLAATLLGPAHGLDQRVGLTLVDGWLMVSALVVLRACPGTPPIDAQAQRSARSRSTLANPAPVGDSSPGGAMPSSALGRPSTCTSSIRARTAGVRKRLTWA